MNSDQMKQLFGEMIDQFAGNDQMRTIKEDISSMEKKLTDSISQLRQELYLTIDEIKAAFTIDLDTLKAEVSLLRAESASRDMSTQLKALEATIGEKSDLFDSSFTMLAEKIAEALKNQKAALETRILSLEKRTSESESLVARFRGEHERITTLISQFANTFSSQYASNEQTIQHLAPVSPTVEACQNLQIEEEPEMVLHFDPRESKQHFNRPLFAHEIDKGALSVPQATAEYEIDLSDIEFYSSEPTNYADIAISANGQHIYKSNA